MNAETYAEHAEAILATSRGRLTGKEIEACEWATSGDQFEDDMEILNEEEPEEPDWLDEEPDEDDFENVAEFEKAMDEWEEERDDFESEHDQWEDECSELSARQSKFEYLMKLLKSLDIEFSREIGEWIANRDREISRKAVETHNRLYPQAA